MDFTDFNIPSGFYTLNLVCCTDARRLCSKVLRGWKVYLGERRRKLALRHKAERVFTENTVRSVSVRKAEEEE